MLILRCVHLGELLSPLPGAWFSGSCLSCDSPAPWQPCLVPGTRLHQEVQQQWQRPAIQPRVSSSSNYHSLPVRRGLDAPGAGVGALICTTQGCPVAGKSSLFCALPTSACPRRNTGSPLGHPGPCTPGPALPNAISPEGKGARPPLSGAGPPNLVAYPKCSGGLWYSSPLPISDCGLW